MCSVGGRCAYQTIEVRVLDDVGVDKDEAADARVGELLSKVRAAATEPHEADTAGSQEIVAVRPEKTLPREPFFHVPPKRAHVARQQ